MSVFFIANINSPGSINMLGKVWVFVSELPDVKSL